LRVEVHGKTAERKMVGSKGKKPGDDSGVRMPERRQLSSLWRDQHKHRVGRKNMDVKGERGQAGDAH